MTAPSRHDAARELLPDFGRIQHLPHKPNTDRGDLIATAEEASIIFRSTCIAVEEKIDGSQVGAGFDGDVPIIRNKNHVLVKGYGRKNTSAKKQYAPLWNWVYEHENRFRQVEEAVGGPAGIYGEWIFAEHTIRYDKAPEDFIAYEVVVDGKFLDPIRARKILEKAGFAVPELIMWHISDGDPLSASRKGIFYELLESMTLQPSLWSTRDRREGVMVKVGDGERMLARFKMRRSDFKPREDFNDGPILRRGA